MKPNLIMYLSMLYKVSVRNESHSLPLSQVVQCQAFSTSHHGWEEAVWRWGGWRWAVCRGGGGPSTFRCCWDGGGKWLEQRVVQIPLENINLAKLSCVFSITGACQRTRQWRQTRYTVIFVLDFCFLVVFDGVVMPHFLLIFFLVVLCHQVVWGNRSFTFPLVVSLSVGGLVKKILETKKDYELSPSSPKSKEQVCTAVVALIVTTRGQYQPTSLQLVIMWPGAHVKPCRQPFFLESLLPRASALTTVKCPVQHWLLSKERYKQMEQRGVIAPPCNHKNAPLQWSWRANNQTSKYGL